MPNALSQLEDILSLVVLRLFAKKKKRMISADDFSTLESFGALQAINIVTVSHRRAHLQEMLDEELRKACELISDRTCGHCKGSGIRDKRNARYRICKCVSMVHYRGDSALPLGEQYSNEYFKGEFSLDQMGKTDTVLNVSNAVMLFLMPR
jgi:hypothetical protein